MRSLQIQNPVLDKTYKTRLASDYSSGVSLTVENNSSFTANDQLVVGEPGEELTELKKLDSVSGSTGMAIPTALKFSHSKGTYIYKSPWDFVSIERRTSELGSFVEISQSPIQWDNADNLTIYFDADATDDYGYRFRFYNSITTKYSEYSPTLTGIGFTRDQVGYMIQQVRLITNDTQRKIVSDDEIIRFFNKAQDIIYTHNQRWWFLLVDAKQQALGISATANTNIYSLAALTNFGHLESVRYRYTSGATDQIWRLLKKSALEFDKIAYDINRTADDQASIFKMLPADASSAFGYIQIFPKTLTTGVGLLYPNYYEKMADLNSVDDSTQVPLPQLLEDYAIGQVERIKGNDTKAQIYEQGLVGGTVTRNGRSSVVEPSALKMLDKMDQAQREVQGQPRSLWNFKGQKAVSRLFSNYRGNHDNLKEFYME